MASSKKSSTSKTARVMNLLSKSREDAPLEQPVVSVPAATEAAPTPDQPSSVVEPVVTPSPAPAPAPAPTAHTNHTTPLISSMQTDSAISNQVLSALETALEDELKSEQAESPAVPVPTNESVSSPEPVADEPIAEVIEESPAKQDSAPIPQAPAEEPAVVPVPTAPEVAAVTPEEPVAVPVQPAPAASEPAAPAPAPVAEESDKEPAPPTQFKVDAHTTYVNVMETLVEEKANKYIDLFGLCKCHRCVADVKAYALNHLNPKYVVMRTGEVIPRITLYENQFSAVVTAQILNACKIVMASPRHDQT